MKGEPLIELKNVSKSFGGYNILDKINLTIYRGEALVIIGPSGTGKSTILRLIAGLLPLDTGKIYIKGKERKGIIEDGYQPMRIALVFQQAALFDSLTVDENVGFFLYEHSQLSRSKIRKLVDKKLAMVGLHGISDRYPSQLSGGMRKRVSFARALITDQTLNANTKPLLLFDEPTAGLDPIASSRIEDLINKTNNKANGSSIVVSHVLSTIERTSDKVLMLYGGKFRWAGSIDEFKESKDPYVFQFRHGKLNGPMQPKDI